MKAPSHVLSCLVALASTQALAQSGVLTEWVESNPANDSTKIELGYPVPIPVDTPEPFDGFRTYDGLHMRHMDLAASTPWVHPAEVGETRNGRTIWAYRLGDDDLLTPWGLPEPATLTNGGIHAREWQTPETVTGILELIATHPSDHHFYDYLRENVNMVVIPVLNVDGFLQTQRYPSLDYLGTDPDYPDYSPRDGRMRRKNMLDTDEVLATQGDHLNGVDLNRNNPPYWNTTAGQSSSPDPHSLIYHGTEPRSEPEERALAAAAALGPADQLRIYTDVHSFSQVQLWMRSDNMRLAIQTEAVLGVFRNHQEAFPAGKVYYFNGRFGVGHNRGIGDTDEFFTVNYQVPSWTLETEPTDGQSFHAPLPGGGADYGGSGVNGHDGFILPESQISRVREQLAQSFAAVFYRQAGPPNIQEARIVDQQTGAVVYEAAWDPLDDQTRELYVNQLQPLSLGRPYTLWVSFNRPMRWLADGGATVFPGQAASTLDVGVSALVDASLVDVQLGDIGWPVAPFGAPDGYERYATDALRADISFQDSADNRALYHGPTATNLRISTTDMTGMALDADPSTAAYWGDGNWQQYEDALGQQTDSGGRDATLDVTVTDEAQADPFTLEPGIAAAWFDPDHEGEGFIIEILDDGRAVLYWFTYDDQGNQDWYLAVGEVRGNRLLFPQLLRFDGGVFGPDFDPAKVTSQVVGSARFLWSGCDTGSMDWHIGNRHGRQRLLRLTRIMGLDCGPAVGAPITQQAVLSGAWFDPTHNGEGFTVEVLFNGTPVVYWFSFGPDGRRRWYFGVGSIQDGKLVFDNLQTSRGGVFGDGFDPAAVEYPPWGSLVLDLRCNGGTADYTSTEEGFGAGHLDLVRATVMTGFSCEP